MKFLEFARADSENISMSSPNEPEPGPNRTAKRCEWAGPILPMVRFGYEGFARMEGFIGG